MMNDECAPLCETCDKLHMDAMCPIDPNAENAWRAGDLDKMFRRIVDDPQFQAFQPRVLSRPDYVNGDTEDTADYQIGPWVVVLDSFLSEEESTRISVLGGKEGYERSTDVGPKNEEGFHTAVESVGRTSYNAWCYSDCMSDPVVERVVERMENLTGIPSTNGEHLQLLR